MQPYLVTLGLLAALAWWFYNTLVARRNAVENAFASIDVYLKKRFDLVPGLVAVVTRYAAHEADTLAKVTEMRARAAGTGSGGSEEQVALGNQVSAGLGRLLVAVEAYPDLKADESFQQLQRTLNEIEEQLSASRRAFNAAVTDFNSAIDMFPGNLMAFALHFSRRTLLVTAEAERANVNVQDLLKG